MTLKDLKKAVDFLMEDGHSEDIVLIDLDMPSVGARASCKVKYINSGFDWEHGQIRISADVPIVKQKHTYADPKPKHKTVYDSSRPIYHCPTCGNSVKKDSKFCEYCGQALLPETEQTTHIRN